MGAAFFYHLTQSDTPSTLAMLLPKARQAGWRVELRGRSREILEKIDVALWQGPPDHFLPHGLAGGDHDADQPILLTDAPSGANDPTCLMTIHGAELSPDEVNAMERTCILFDGHDPDAVAHARIQWKTLTSAGCSAQYWSQESGRWEKKAEA